MPAAYQKLPESDCGYLTATPCQVLVGLEKHTYIFHDHVNYFWRWLEQYFIGWTLFLAPSHHTQ